MVVIDHLHEAGIHAAREARMTFDQPTIALNRGGIRIRHNLDCVRVPHRHYGHLGRLVANVERPQHGGPHHPRWQFGSVEWHLLRHEDGRAHIDRDPSVILKAWRDNARQGLYTDFALLSQSLVDHEFHECPRTIAALLDLAAIRVKNPVAKIDTGGARTLDDQYLVGADAETSVSKLPPLLGRKINGLIDRVNHDEIIACAMHLGELQFHGSAFL
jgi:hypothetical protein